MEFNWSTLECWLWLSRFLSSVSDSSHIVFITAYAEYCQVCISLLDCCSGGWHKSHQGGADAEFPHHLADLTIWNYKATKTSGTGTFTWWDNNPKWYFLPPVIVGFQGAVTFDETQAKVSSHGVEAYPQSLYESQLKKRLGEVPSWLLNIK